MPATKCPSCGSLEFDTAPSCTRCDQRLRPYDFPPPPPFQPDAQQISASRPFGATGELLYVSIPKFIVLSVCTFGLYQLYWIYQNWTRIQTSSHEDLSPFWRTLFAGIWNFSLFSRVQQLSRTAGFPAGWSPIGLGIAGILTSFLAWNAPAPYDLLSFLAFLPYLPVVISANRLTASRHHPAAPTLDEPFSGWHIAIIAVGGTLVLAAIIGTFIAPHKPA